MPLWPQLGPHVTARPASSLGKRRAPREADRSVLLCANRGTLPWGSSDGCIGLQATATRTSSRGCARDCRISIVAAVSPRAPPVLVRSIAVAVDLAAQVISDQAEALARRALASRWRRVRATSERNDVRGPCEASSRLASSVAEWSDPVVGVIVADSTRRKLCALLLVGAQHSPPTPRPRHCRLAREAMSIRWSAAASWPGVPDGRCDCVAPTSVLQGMRWQAIGLPCGHRP